jgi:hypothetical protein
VSEIPTPSRIDCRPLRQRDYPGPPVTVAPGALKVAQSTTMSQASQAMIIK